MRSIGWVARGSFIGALVLSSTTALSQQGGKEQAALAAALHGKHVALARALAAAAAQGKPISAKYEYEDGKLGLSVYTAKGGEFSEVTVNQRTGKVAKTDKITEGEDLNAAKAQWDAAAGANASLATALHKALAANKGYSAVSVIATRKDGRAVADITLLKRTEFKTVSEPLR